MDTHKTEIVYETKLKEVRAALDALHEMIDDHLHDSKNLDIPVLDLIKGAIEIYENIMGEEE